MLVVLTLKTFVQRLKPLEGLRAPAAARKDDGIIGIPLRLVKMPVGANLHSMRTPNIKTIVDGRGHDLDAAPAEHVDNGHGLDFLKSVSQWD